jgi:putative PIG3 family NAD(P)H quinone oxidoreductase
MKAAVITRPGETDVLEIRQVDDPPKPTADRVLVRVRAAALNRADVLQRQGKYPPPPGAPRDIPGMEFSGEVSQIGPEVYSWQTGDRVFGICAGGAQAEFVTVPANHLAQVPENLSWTDAAAVPEVFITAHDALFTQAGLQPGETVLIHAAGSGVGTAAIQLVRATGGRSFGTSRSADKLERAKQYGLDESVVVGDDAKGFVDVVKEWTNNRGVDVILDLVGADYLEANLLAIAQTGRLMLVGTPSGSRANIDFGLVMSKRLSIRGTVLRGRSNEEKATATRLFSRHVVPLLAAGIVKPVVDVVFRLEEIREAHRMMESNQNFGKIVLSVE